MDEMTEYEAELLISNLQYADRVSWEQTRLQMFSSVVPYSKKKIQPTDILKFEWENQRESNHYTDEDIEVIEAQQAEFEQFIKNTMN